MIRLALVLLVVFFPVAGFAQKILVRSGEHGDFSRLAFSFATPVEWKMGRVANGYEIRLQGNSVPIDISGVYRRISRERIKNISVSKGNSSIVLSVDCPCHADAFEFRAGLLVVDIKDGLPKGDSPFETAFASDETSDVVPNEPAQVVKVLTEDIVETAANPDQQPVPQHLPESSGSFGNGLALLPKVNLEESGRITKMQSEMLRQIGRAAAQGLLDANLPVPSHDTQPVKVTEEPRVEAPESTRKEHINIHIENSVDREISRLLPERTVPNDGSACIGNDAVNVQEWGGEGAVWKQISEQRRKLSGEFDKANPEAAEALAKAYIYAGFGAESMRVIDEFGVDPEKAGILKEMARIVDGLVLLQNGVLQGQSGCDSAVALWAVLSMPAMSKGTEINRSMVISGFSALPLHLRRHLGPQLAGKFLAIGDMETASAIRNAIARAPGDAGAEFRLMEARFEQERGHHDAAEQTLTDIAKDNSAVALEALIGLLETKAERKSDVSEELLVTAESYLFEQKTNENGARLLRAIALIRAQSGDLLAALHKLRAIKVNSFFDDQAETQVWEDVLAVAGGATDEAFLKFVFAARKDISEQGISRSAHQTIALRLIELGFSEMAMDMLDPPSPPTNVDRLIMAKAALLDGKGGRAITLLEHASGEEVAGLRAQAFEMLGDYEKAAEEYAALQDQDGQKAALWQAEGWARLQEIGSDPEKMLARSMITDSQMPNQRLAEEILATNALLIEESGRFRRSVEELINGFPAPSGG
ncbi:hypothetical protein [Profundibacter sp.]